VLAKLYEPNLHTEFMLSLDDVCNFFLVNCVDSVQISHTQTRTPETVVPVMEKI